MSKMETKVVKVRRYSDRACADKRALWNGSRSREEADFFTIGYQGRKIDELIPALRDAGVKSLVDVRYNPVSRFRPEMSKSNLRRLIESAGLEYLHVREWGIPPEIRNSGTIWEWYDENVVGSYFRGDGMKRLLSLQQPVAMMCMECDPAECHRHRLFLALERCGLRGFDL
jgi:uncharacterized protein (DUF488 family)